MIYQLYHRHKHRAFLFETELYRGLGLEPAVNPNIITKCPELASPLNRSDLCEYGGMLNVWRNKRANAHDWIGFTSFRQLAKSPVIFWPSWRPWIEETLDSVDIIAWRRYQFRTSLAEQFENVHPGMNHVLEIMLSALYSQEAPARWRSLRSGFFCNYWIMSHANFISYMDWSWPLVRWMLEHREQYPALTHRTPRSGFPAIGCTQERLVMLWAMIYEKKVAFLEPSTGGPSHDLSDHRV